MIAVENIGSAFEGIAATLGGKAGPEGVVTAERVGTKPRAAMAEGLCGERRDPK